MRVKTARVDDLEFPLVEPFETSFGVERRRRFLLLTLTSDSGEVGLGECVAARDPLYSSETVETARWMLTKYLLPLVLKSPDLSPREFCTRSQAWRGNRMAKATVEMALWDLRARTLGLPLARALGGRRSRVEVGVSVGIQKNAATLVRRIGNYLDDGYRRVKLKVRPGWDEIPLSLVRTEYPDLRLWVDANQAYRTSDIPRIAEWATRFRVEQVEQPFPERAIRAHSRLRRMGRFRVCLDESVVDATSLRDAIEARALSSLNVKPGRVGGLTEACSLQRIAGKVGIPAWVGGMLETGVGRAHGVHLATLSNFRFPGDLSASDRYYREELIDGAFELGPGSTLGVPKGPGLGVTVSDRSRHRHLLRSRSYRR